MKMAKTRDQDISSPAKTKVRQKTYARKSKPKKLRTEPKYYPYISAKAKASFSDYIQRK